MTLRARLLLLYLMVVLLGAATVVVAIVESEHWRRVDGALQPWNDMALAAQKLESSLSSAGGPADPARQDEFLPLLVGQYPKLNEAAKYRDVDRVREALNIFNIRFLQWRTLPPDLQPARLDDLRDALQRYSTLVEDVLGQLRHEKGLQQTRERLLLAVGVGLTVIYVVVIGTLLRRWLLRPLQRLNRQVAALARDEPPPEPLPGAPLEIATLARALEQARQSLGSLRQQILDSERLTTIGQVAAQLAHNLRNPLASIRAAAQLIGRHELPDSGTRRRMDEIIASVDRMNHWIVGLMEIATAQPSPVQPADVVPTLRRVAEAVAPDLAAKELTLSLDLPAGSLVCMHDPATLEHALVAMVVNAIEASPLGGAIHLRAERAEEDPDTGSVGGSSTVSPQCRISVIDRGPGLPADAPERIFEYSYSTKQRGMGLGLALARQALRRQGGSAHAFNNIRGGAIVCVDLPLISPDSPLSVQNHAQDPDRRG
ncbi:MAG TPA: ATP-binding protein [Phycisphaerae bacterium]|nr:ATP-binding protein [Phycisphaerae bacterium]